MLQRKPSLQVRFSKLLWLCTKFCAFLASPSPWKESKGNRARFLFAGSRVEVFRRRGKRNPRLLNVSLVTFSTPRKSPHGVTGSRSLQMSQAKPATLPQNPGPAQKAQGWGFYCISVYLLLSRLLTMMISRSSCMSVTASAAT